MHGMPPRAHTWLLQTHLGAPPGSITPPFNYPRSHGVMRVGWVLVYLEGLQRARGQQLTAPRWGRSGVWTGPRRGAAGEEFGVEATKHSRRTTGLLQPNRDPRVNLPARPPPLHGGFPYDPPHHSPISLLFRI